MIDDPAPWVAGTLRSALATQGITVTGQVRMGTASSNAVTVASLSSPPLTRLASVMNRESINHFAELMFRNVALPMFLTQENWAVRLHQKKGGIPYGIALAAAGLLIYPKTPWLSSLAI